MLKNVFVITYGTTRWGVKFETGPVLKLYKTKEEAIDSAMAIARRYGSDVYVEVKGKFVKAKKTEE